MACFPSQRISEIFDGQEFIVGPELPFGADSSCAAEVEAGVVFIGGAYSSNVREAYLIDVDSGDVTTLPEMPNDRGYHCCGTAVSPSGGIDIVVAGGIYEWLTADIFNTELGVWRPGPNLPNPIEYVRMVLLTCGVVSTALPAFFFFSSTYDILSKFCISTLKGMFQLF